VQLQVVTLDAALAAFPPSTYAAADSSRKPESDDRHQRGAARVRLTIPSLYFCNILPRYFARDGHDLHLSVPLTLHEAVMGTELTVRRRPAPIEFW
jgi:hypothetical protein